MSSPPKPWENSHGTNDSGITPQIPARPYQAQNNNYGINSLNYGGYGGYGSYSGGYGSYSSGYGRFGGGGYGNGMYGGGYGSGYSSYNRRLMPNHLDGNSLMQRMEQSTQSTFQMLDQIVQAFGGFSQMLESTFYATHSSFMALMGVADQFAHLRKYLGQMLSMVSIYQTIKSFYYQATGQRIPVDPSQISPSSFVDFYQKRPSKRPLLVFFALVFGLPYLFSKLLKRIDNPANLSPSEIQDLEFCKAVYDFNSNQPGDLFFKKGDLIAVLSKFDPQTNLPGDWWTGRTQDGRVGIFPYNYVEKVLKVKEVESPDSKQHLSVLN
jgi:peroxin-13